MAKQVPINVTVTKHGRVAVLEMSGTENRVNNEFCRKWNDALDKAESWPDVRALVTTGSGKFYSNGLDLNFLGACSKQELVEFRSLFATLRKRLICSPLVTVAAINGHCFAAGLIVALLHDYRVMHNGRGWMCLNEVDLGLRFSDAMRALFKAKFTPNMVRDVALYGHRFQAEQALAIGLIDDIAEEGKAVSKAVDKAMKETDGRTYDRQVLSAMKKDFYGEIVTADDSYPGGIGKQMMESKL